MATILAHIHIKRGMEEQFEAIARSLYATSHESEKGLRRYEYWRGEEEGLYYTLLSFDDFLSFIAHQTSDHHETASPQIGAVVAGIRLEWVDPIRGASPLVVTEAQQPPADADALTAAYARRFAATIAEWWGPLRAG